MKTTYKIAIGVIVFTLLAALGFWLYWPKLLEGYLRQRTYDLLAQKFDGVEIGAFDLSYDHVQISGLTLTKGSAQLKDAEVFVKFDPNFGDPIIHKVEVQEGHLLGTLDDFLDKKATAKSGSGPSKFEQTEIFVSDLALDVQVKDYNIQGVFSLSGKISSLVNIHVDQVTITNHDAYFSANRVWLGGVVVHDPFPLSIELEDANVSKGSFSAEHIAGSILVSDTQMKKISGDLKGEFDEQDWGVKGAFDRETGIFYARGWATGIRPKNLPGVPSFVEGNKGTISAEVDIQGDKEITTFFGNVKFEDVVAQHPALSPLPVTLNFEVEFDEAYFDRETKSVEVHALEVFPLTKGKRKDISLGAQASLSHYGEPDQRLAVSLWMSADCQEMLGAIPMGMTYGISGLQVKGPASLDAQLMFDMEHPEDTEVDGGIDLSKCKILKTPEQVQALKGNFTHIVKMKNGHLVTKFISPSSPSFTSIWGVPSYVHMAVVSTEDGGFWAHSGFLTKQLKASIKKNIETGNFKRGGSTITMQMVKNVLLSHEKTISRKLQEMILTWVVEQELSKDRIMELYLNVVEFGPGIFGIEDAAQHYFGVSAEDLTSLEAAFLATLLPKPIDRHEMWCKNKIPENHLSYVQKIHQRMLARKAMSQESFDFAEEKGLVFSRTQWHGEKQCLAEGEAARGEHVQKAVSGLLARGSEAYP